MKSSKLDLAKRGYIELFEMNEYRKLNQNEVLKYLESNLPYKRTIAVRLISERNLVDDYADKLLKMFEIEKALYTKIEIGQALEKGNIETCKKMINYLGKIGNNQHTSIYKASLKKSYPLPRDIIARSLAKMDTHCLETLLQVLESDDLLKISEILDAIGFMIFYDPVLQTKANFNKIKITSEKYYMNELIMWKCILCFSAFKINECKEYLIELRSRSNNEKLLLEINRSLVMIG